MKNLSRRTVRSPLNAVEVMGEIESKQIAGISTMVDHGHPDESSELLVRSTLIGMCSGAVSNSLPPTQASMGLDRQ